MHDSGQSKGEHQPLTLSTVEAASLAGVDRKTITNMCNRGELKACRMGKVWRINRADFMQHIEGQYAAAGKAAR